MTDYDAEFAKLDDDEQFYRSLPDPEMRDEMLRCIEVERAALRREQEAHE